MRKRVISSLVVLVGLLAGWMVLRTRAGALDSGSGDADAPPGDAAPAPLDAPDLAASGAPRRASIATDPPSGAPPHDSAPASADDRDDFPRIETATVVLTFEPNPDVRDLVIDLMIDAYLRPSASVNAIQVRQAARSDAIAELVLEVSNVPVGPCRVRASMLQDPWWIPESISVVAPRTACHLKAARGDAARFLVSANLRGAGASANVAAYDGEDLVAGVRLQENSAVQPTEIRLLPERPVTFVCSLFPGAKSVGILEPITVIGRAGQTQSVVFGIPSTTSVSVHVKGHDGSPIRSAHVLVWRIVGGSAPIQAGEQRYTEAGGPIFKLVPGPYEGRVCGVAGHASRSFRFEVLAEPTQDVDVRLDAADDFALRVRGPNGAPAPDVTAWVGAIDSPEPDGLATAYATTDAQGLARVPPLEPGTYRLAIDQMLSAPTLIRATTDILVVDRPVRRAGDASLRVHVAAPSGHPLTSAFVWLEREGDAWGPYANISDGLASFTGLERGAWHVRIMSSWFFSEQVAPFDGRVFLRPGETRDIEIRLKSR